MVEVTINVLRSDNLNDTEGFTTVNLPGVPRVGENVIVKGALFEVRAVCWTEDYVTLTCYEMMRGYDFPVY